MKLIKSYAVLNLDPKLDEILRFLDDRIGDGIITSAYRPNDRGVHGTQPVRAVDRRCRDFEVGDVIAEMLNESWIYDPDRPWLNVCLVHDKGQGMHLHIQVHPHTEVRPV